MKRDSDSHGVWIETWVIDLVDGDFAAALLLSQLLYWHQPHKMGRTRITTTKDGVLWLFRADDEWEEDCRLTVRQVRRIRSHLKSRGLIEHRVFRVDGGATVSAWRPVYPIIQEACDAAEVASRLTPARRSGVTRSRHSERKSGVTRSRHSGDSPADESGVTRSRHSQASPRSDALESLESDALESLPSLLEDFDSNDVPPLPPAERGDAAPKPAPKPNPRSAGTSPRQTGSNPRGPKPPTAADAQLAFIQREVCDHCDTTEGMLLDEAGMASPCPVCNPRPASSSDPAIDALDIPSPL